MDILSILVETIKISPAIGIMLYVIWSQNKREDDREKWLEALFLSQQESVDRLSEAVCSLERAVSNILPK
jgi:hypothetical protein